MTKLLDYTGMQFGRLTVLERAPSKGKKTMWLCKCVCGNTKVVQGCNLSTGHTISCGCYRVECTIDRFTKYTIPQNHPLSVALNNIKIRCYYAKGKYYKRYGGRGIKVCKEWLDNPEEFYRWAMNNGWKEGLTIDRIDNDGDYEPSNCRWVTRKEQANNTSHNTWLSYNGCKQTVSQWSD